MKFKIHCNEDSLVIEGETIEKVREIAFKETSKRGWSQDDCWIEKISD